MNPLLLSEAIPAALTLRHAESAGPHGSFSLATLTGIFATTERLRLAGISVAATNGYTMATIHTNGVQLSAQD